VERILTDWMRDNPERYYAAILAPLAAFYITEEKLTLLFDEFQISTVAGQLTRINFRLENIVHVRPIAPIEYRVRTELYNLKMVDVEAIARYMGYHAVMDFQRGGRVRIYRDEEQTQLITTIYVNVNHFGWDIPAVARSLEISAMMHGNALLVPITFFDRVMPRAAYHVDENGFIHFISYVNITEV